MKLWLQIIFLFIGFQRAVADIPIAHFSYYIEFVGLGADVSFLNESTEGDTYFWDFGDGGTSAEMHPFHHYALPGVFTVCLTAINAECSTTFCDTLITYYAPSADFSFSGDPVVAFTDLSTNYPTSWDWFFGDGEISAETNPTHTFLANGVYNTCLSVGNPGGTNYTCKSVTITSYLTTEAAFTFSGDPTVLFEDHSTLDPYAWHWDFGDGTTSNEQDPTHTFTNNGAFTVCLIATNAGGTDTVCQELTIVYAYPFPEADFTYYTEGLGVAFVDLSTNDPVSWAWDFGDGNFSEEQNPIHVFDESGNYSVCLTATNIGGPDVACKSFFLVSGITNQHDALHVYPNPVQDVVYIVSDILLSDAELILYDASGNKVRQFVHLNGTDIQVPIGDLSAGTYTIQFIEQDTVRYTGSIFIK